MPRDDIGIPCRGATDLKGVGRSSLRRVGILMSAITVLLRILSFGLRLLWYLRFNLKRSTLNVQRWTQNPARRDRARPNDTMRKMEAADWPSLSDQELLERRISTLGLRLEGTALEPLIRQLYDELSERRLIFHPPCHVGDEWFVPIGIPAIFIPFFLVA